VLRIARSASLSEPFRIRRWLFRNVRGAGMSRKEDQHVQLAQEDLE